MTNTAPTLNRMLLFYSAPGADPCASIIVHVHGPAMVNLVWFDHNGGLHAATSVPVYDEVDEAPGPGYFARWPARK